MLFIILYVIYYSICYLLLYKLWGIVWRNDIFPHKWNMCEATYLSHTHIHTQNDRLEKFLDLLTTFIFINYCLFSEKSMDARESYFSSSEYGIMSKLTMSEGIFLI